ncbi:MAG: apolipoprotein N-acyltransferase [candidate division WOR-3 bacterium]
MSRFFKNPLFNYILPAFGGVCLTLSFAPYNFSLLAWIAFIPLFYSLRDGKKPFLKGFIMGFAFFYTLLYWVAFSDVVEGTVVPLVVLGSFLLIIYLSLFFGFSGILYDKLNKRNRVYLFPVVFAGLEFLRSLSSVWGFTWGSVGFSQSHLIHLIQFASIGGLPLVTLWVLALNIFIYFFFKNLRQKEKTRVVYLILFISFIGIPFLYSEIILKASKSIGAYVTVGVIQPNVLPSDKRESSFERLLRIKNLITGAPDADLYVLPETASPFPVSKDNSSELLFSHLAKEKRALIITGMPDYERKEGGYIYYNAAAAIDSSGIEGIYRKIFLVPFVERLPFDDVIPKLKEVDLGQGQYTAGEDFTVFKFGDLAFSVYICYEAIFPQLIRKYVKNGAKMLVNITEDGWFGRTNGPYQHAQMAAFQSIIFRRAVVRSANTGVSLITDPYGRILEKTRIFTTDYIVCEVPLLDCRTVYTRIGNIFGWFYFMFVLLVIAAELMSKYTGHKGV